MLNRQSLHGKPAIMRLFRYILLLLTSASSLCIAEAAQSAEPGSVSGTVSYQADSERPWRYARYYVNGDGRLAEAVVVLRKASGGKIRSKDAVGREAVTHGMDQKDFRFVPETLVIHEGDRVRFTNSDNQLHNVRTGDIAPFNVNTPPDSEYTRTFPKAGGIRRPVRLGCVFHSTMRAWIYVFDHRYFALTGPDGRFAFDDVPAGRYRLTVIHPSGNLQHSFDVTVSAAADAGVPAILTPDHLTVRRRQP